MGMQPTELWTLRMVEQAPSPAAISSSTDVVGHDPGVGTAMFFRHQHAEETRVPHLLEFGGWEGVPSSRAAAPGANRSRAKSRAVSRIWSACL